MKSEHARWFAVGIASLALVGLGLIAAPRIAGAVVDGDIRAGVYPDADAVAVGGGVLAPVGNSGRWFFNPNLEVAMGDTRNIIAMSGDFHYDFAEQGSASFWMGGGPAVLVTDRRFGNSDTDLGLNVLTGVGARHGDVRPFAQVRGTMANSSQVTLAAGIRF